MQGLRPVIRADHEAHNMGGNEPDKADTAGNGDSKPGDERACRKEEYLKALDIDSKVDCIILPHGKDVELAREEEKGKRGRENDDAQFYVVPGYVPEPSHEPEEDLVQVLAGTVP